LNVDGSDNGAALVVPGRLLDERESAAARVAEQETQPRRPVWRSENLRSFAPFALRSVWPLPGWRRWPSDLRS